jgi:hypothetical protein
MMGAWLQGHVQGAAPGALTGLGDRDRFCVGYAAGLGPAAADDLAKIRPVDDGSDRRVRRCAAETPAGKRHRTGHQTAIQFGNRLGGRQREVLVLKAATKLNSEVVSVV